MLLFFFSSLSPDSISVRKLTDSLSGKFDKIIICIHNINRRPANNFDISKNALQLVHNISGTNNIIFLFGNAYASANWCNAENLVICYEDDEAVHNTAADMLAGRANYKGTLPVTVCEKYKYGYGITALQGKDQNELAHTSFTLIDSIVNDAVKKKPCRVQ